MAYWKDVWRFPGSTEYEYKYAGKYGAKGEKRQKRKKATPEQIRKQNQANRETRMRRLIKANFFPNDIWATLKYPQGTRKPVGEVMKDVRKFLAAMRREYKKRGQQLKFVYRIEIGEHGGIHIHILVNRLRDNPDTDIIIQNLWKHGRVNYESVYEQGGYERLANYIVKQPEEDSGEAEQLSLFPEEEQKKLIKYSSSRNLVRPEPERSTYEKWTVRKLVEDGPKPTPGYYIDEDSIRTGKNRYTGMSYYKYTEYKIGEWNGGKEEQDADRRNLYRDKPKRACKRRRAGNVPHAGKAKKRGRSRERPGGSGVC